MRNSKYGLIMKTSRYKGRSDEYLIKQYGKGHAEAFDSLYRRHKDKLFGFLKRQCNSTEIAEELAHDAWIAVINQASNYQPHYKFVTWIYRIAHNRLIDHWRKNGHSAQALFDEIQVQQLTQTEGDQLQTIEINDLFDSLTQLSAEQMEVVLLRIEGFTHDEIATITNSKKETVKSRLRYATKHLRAAMEATP